jgi:7,8-dihydropterin-6-yl-methyl-4-(beta-D-ribofuranosyl)aminobenzene 5'-phosphate synthase
MVKYFHLREADRVEITVLVDNYTDTFLASNEHIRRPPICPPDSPLAEHGLSCLVKVNAGSEEHTVLLDAGHSAACLLHNLDFLKVDITRIESVVLSHGHIDHFAGLTAFLEKAGKQVSLVLHPDAFLERRLNIQPENRQVPMPRLDENAIKETGVKLVKNTGPLAVASGLVMVTGEVERLTAFEKGFPWLEAKIDGKWVIDPMNDDQGIVVSVKGKGLVVIGGCSHAGIINTVKYARKITGIERVHAVLGGFHLTGPVFEPIINPTIEEMKKIKPDYIVPMHCTGWNAINAFSREMPEQFILNGVGTQYIF